MAIIMVFLEPMRIKGNKHEGKVYDIHLFTISPDKQKVYLGYLKNAIGVSSKESQDIFNIYQKKERMDRGDAKRCSFCGRNHQGFYASFYV